MEQRNTLTTHDIFLTYLHLYLLIFLGSYDCHAFLFIFSWKYFSEEELKGNFICIDRDFDTTQYISG